MTTDAEKKAERVTAAAGATTAVPGTSIRTPLATLLAGHVIQDGEVVLMILKPSRLFVPLNSMRFAGVVLIVLIAALLWNHDVISRPSVAGEIALFVITGHLMSSMLQWMGRYYILTDMRIIRLSGILTTEFFSCPLRKVAGTRVVRGFRERVLGLGTIDIIPTEKAGASWQTVRRPIEVNEAIAAAISKARQGASGGHE